MEAPKQIIDQILRPAMDEWTSVPIESNSIYGTIKKVKRRLTNLINAAYSAGYAQRDGERIIEQLKSE